MSGAVIFAGDLGRQLGVSEDEIYELARTRKLPFAVSTAHPRRLFIEEKDLNIWKEVVNAAA
jgi:hypothetical protein